MISYLREHFLFYFLVPSALFAFGEIIGWPHFTALVSSLFLLISFSFLSGFFIFSAISLFFGFFYLGALLLDKKFTTFLTGLSWYFLIPGILGLFSIIITHASLVLPGFVFQMPFHLLHPRFYHLVEIFLSLGSFFGLSSFLLSLLLNKAKI